MGNYQPDGVAVTEGETAGLDDELPELLPVMLVDGEGAVEGTTEVEAVAAGAGPALEASLDGVAGDAEALPEAVVSPPVVSGPSG